MIRVSKTVSINGVEVTMLFTPRLFVMAADKGINIEIDAENVMNTLSVYADICYCAALNYWTMNHDIDDFSLERVDFHAWSASEPADFRKAMTIAVEALSGKTMRDIIVEQKEEIVKKKPKSNVITRLLRRFW